MASICCVRLPSAQKPIFCVNRNQPLIYDIFGPFPDETFLSILDRILYFLGVCPLQKTSQACTITIKPRAEGNDSSSDTETYRTCNSSVSICKAKNSNQTKTIKCCSRRGKMCCQRVKIEECVKESKGNHASCACSSACRKIKEMCAKFYQDNCQWHWTRTHHLKDGAIIYEVFKQISQNRDSKDIQLSKTPQLVFIVLPNGSIIPFELVIA